MRHGPAHPLGHSWLWGHRCACRCRSSALFIVGGVVVVYIIAGRSLVFIGQSFVGCWLSLFSLCAVIEVLGGCCCFGQLDLFVVVWVV